MLSRSGNPREQAVSAAKWFTFLVSGLFLLFLSTMQLKELMLPGPLSAKHRAIDQCNECHTKFSDNSYWWISAAFSAPHPDSDSKRCISCHSIDGSPLAAHNMSETMLTQITTRLQTNSGGQSKSLLSLAKLVSPASMTKHGELYCATCHQEHRGKNADLKAISDKQCQTCHTVEFNSFQEGHPVFESYPKSSVSAVRFDHKSHFDKHFVEMKKERKAETDERPFPDNCTFCHQESAETQSMTIKPFSETCHSCHINQILGKDRATGPEGVAFFSIPGLDLRTLGEKKVKIGEWPENSEAEPSPILMQLLASREVKPSILKSISKLDLLDLSNASDDQIDNVRQFAWEVKKLLSDLLWGQETTINNLVAAIFDSKLDREIITNLTANIPRDVLAETQQQWFPNLKGELDNPGRETPNTNKQTNKKSTQSKNKVPVRKKNAQQKTTRTNTGSASWRVDPFGKLLKGDEPTRSVGSENSNAEENSSQSENSVFPNKDVEAANDTDASNSEEIFGGWYRRDYTIFYKPVGHADRFLQSWLQLTKSDETPANKEFMRATFKSLSNPEAPGRCAKCHKLEKIPVGQQTASKSISDEKLIFGKIEPYPRLTKFVHKPHLSPIEGKGCMSCHELDNTQKNKTSKSTGGVTADTPNFKFMEKSNCESCHTKNKVRTDCLLCHNYHLNPVTVQLPSDKLLQSN